MYVSRGIAQEVLTTNDYIISLKNILFRYLEISISFFKA